ncbi:TetR/AcrR family transcriptional regulator [Pseudonocardia sp. RS11V-5]|uniref:TetR/AcrR family transcriptional regulator n=1 Tax=Pseudonocardia terrae TaxID=2905831 RepID=UPI001E2B0D9A|nr:TetR/AcrR family transcriptional regulator [Pseudonocardia terrae]MCE3554640.1 TetR/AcrR family transcriptional regulator [Pseudonocardia terrae]
MPDPAAGAPEPRQGRAGRPAQSRAATEQLLVDAAVDLLRERGVLAGMNLREIADRAEVHRALVYHYFGSRQELLRAAAKREIARPRDEVPGEEDMGTAEWLTTSLDASLRYREAIRLIVMLVLDHDHTVRTLTTRRAMMSRLDPEPGAREPAVDDPAALYAVYASMSYGFGLLSERFAAELGLDPDDLERRFLDLASRMFDAVARDGE